MGEYTLKLCSVGRLAGFGLSHKVEFLGLLDIAFFCFFFFFHSSSPLLFIPSFHRTLVPILPLPHFAFASEVRPSNCCQFSCGIISAPVSFLCLASLLFSHMCGHLLRQTAPSLRLEPSLDSVLRHPNGIQITHHHYWRTTRSIAS